MSPHQRRRRLGFLVLIIMGIGVLAGCTPTTSGGGGLAAGLTARMDVAGARLDRAQALDLVNAYRRATGAPALAADASLDARAEDLARSYSASGQPPRKPGNVAAMRISAGYQTFAETFSGWRNSPADAQVLADRSAGRAGIAVINAPQSSYGVYWVLLLD